MEAITGGQWKPLERAWFREAYGATVKLGIMQGRLVPPEPERFQSFPRQRWREEFALAQAAGLETIEWIYDAYGEDVNPLGTDAASRRCKH